MDNLPRSRSGRLSPLRISANDISAMQPLPTDATGLVLLGEANLLEQKEGSNLSTSCSTVGSSAGQIIVHENPQVINPEILHHKLHGQMSEVLQHALRGQTSKVSSSSSGEVGTGKGAKKRADEKGKGSRRSLRNLTSSTESTVTVASTSASLSPAILNMKTASSIYTVQQQQRLSNRYQHFWGGINSMIDIQNRTKLGDNSKTNKGHKYKNEFERLSALHLIHPSGKIKVLWDMVAGCAIFYSVLEVPFSISFLQNAERGETSVSLDYFVIAVFFSDILVTFTASYVDSHTDKLITDRRLIMWNYGKFWLWIDLVSSIPFDAIQISTDNSGRVGCHTDNGLRTALVLSPLLHDH